MKDTMTEKEYKKMYPKMKKQKQQFECYNCNKLNPIENGVWVNNGGSWSMVIICKDCYNKEQKKKA